jgi:hypothetical protein
MRGLAAFGVFAVLAACTLADSEAAPQKLPSEVGRLALPITNSEVLRLLRDGEECPDTAPPNFYGPGLGGMVWKVSGLGRLSAYGATPCNSGGSPFSAQCIINGPGGVSLKATGDEQTLFYVPPGFTALFEIGGRIKNCTMVSSQSSSAGRKVNSIVDRYTKSRAQDMYDFGVSALHRNDFLDAGAYLQNKFEPAEAGFLAGVIYDRGLGSDGYTNKQLAAFLIGRSASLGYYPAQLRLSEMYNDGVGVGADQRTASYWLHKAVSNPKKGPGALDVIVETAASHSTH